MLVEYKELASINKDKFKLGDVLKVYYLYRLGKFRRVFSFIGVCVKLGKTFTIQNNYNKELVRLNFVLDSPNIFTIQKLTSYNFTVKKPSLHKLRKLRLLSKTDLIRIMYFPDPPIDLAFDIFKPGKVTAKERKRLRDKFRV